MQNGPKIQFINQYRSLGNTRVQRRSPQSKLSYLKRLFVGSLPANQCNYTSEQAQSHFLRQNIKEQPHYFNQSSHVIQLKQNLHNSNLLVDEKSVVNKCPKILRNDQMISNISLKHLINKQNIKPFQEKKKKSPEQRNSEERCARLWNSAHYQNFEDIYQNPHKKVNQSSNTNLALINNKKHKHISQFTSPQGHTIIEQQMKELNKIAKMLKKIKKQIKLNRQVMIEGFKQLEKTRQLKNSNKLKKMYNAQQTGKTIFTQKTKESFFTHKKIIQLEGQCQKKPTVEYQYLRRKRFG